MHGMKHHLHSVVFKSCSNGPGAKKGPVPGTTCFISSEPLSSLLTVYPLGQNGLALGVTCFTHYTYIEKS